MVRSGYGISSEMGSYSTGGTARERKLIRCSSGANSQVWMGEENEKLHDQFKRKAPDSSDVIRFYFTELFF